MKGLIMFIAFLIFLIFVMLWFCLKVSSKASRMKNYAWRYRYLYRNIARKYNNLSNTFIEQKNTLDIDRKSDI